MKSQVLGDPVTWLVLHPVSEQVFEALNSVWSVQEEAVCKEISFTRSS
jgi:hypothetical protein